MRRIAALATAVAGLMACRAFTAPAQAATPSAQVSCQSLADVPLPDTIVVAVQEVTSGSFNDSGAAPGGGNSMSGLPAFCRYAGIVKPKINFEVWLPLQNWNGRLQGGGNGGLAGSLSYSDLAKAVKTGFVGVATDTGHSGSDNAWLTDQQQLADYGYRAIHEMTVRAKALAKVLYGQGPQYSYFDGCSTGGGQALMSAQRYPEDYDGILAGASNWNQTRLRAGGHIWAWSALHATPDSALSRAQFTLVTNAAIEKCDAADGVKDGVIDDPAACKFDAAALACKAGQSGDECLNPAQVAAVNRIYAGSRNPRTGEAIWPAYVPGSESGWSVFTGATPFGAASAFFQYAVFRDPSFDFTKFDFDKDVAKAETGYAAILDATNPDLRAFRDHGGKLIIYHGYADPMITPLASIQYYRSVVDFFGRQAKSKSALSDVQQFARLFMLPGVGHCGGGAGPDQFDGMQALQDWVERRQAPARIVAAHVSGGKTDRTRPLCAWPAKAVYKGTGDSNDAANFECKS
ncbi:MAG: tannase/feruloyl esterase family alpha/beta hydrolase [Steroidobacteraceae bacterium]